MWCSGFVLGMIFLSTKAQEDLVQFRAPKGNDGLLTEETFEDSDPVSFFYVDVYGGIAKSINIEVTELFPNNPCLMMEPALSLVKNHMTFYGTCNYDEMFQLKLINSNGKWTASVKLSENGCKKDFIADFRLTWQGINHTITSKLNKHGFGSMIIHLLMHKQGMSYKASQSLYPVLKLHFGKAPAKNCRCLNGSEFEFRKTWYQLCPATISPKKSGTRSLFFAIFTLSTLSIIGVIVLVALCLLKTVKTYKIWTQSRPE